MTATVMTSKEDLQAIAKRQVTDVDMAGFYKSRRRAGQPHDSAISSVCERFPAYHGEESRVEKWLLQARKEVEEPDPAPPVAEPEPEPPEPDRIAALAADAERRLGELREQQARLSLDSLTDEQAVAELLDVESELRTAEREIHRAELASTERERRQDEAQREDEAQRRRVAFNRARVLQRDREVAARAVDKGAKALAVALHNFDACCEAQRVALVQAGQTNDSVRILPYSQTIEAAIAFALREAEAPRGIISLMGQVHGREAPLAQSDFRPVEPAEKGAS